MRPMSYRCSLAWLAAGLMLAVPACSGDDATIGTCTTNPSLCAHDGSGASYDSAATPDAQQAPASDLSIASDAAVVSQDAGAADAASSYVHEDVTVDQVHTWLTDGQFGSTMTLIDVRTAGEFAGGHIEGAINIPVDQLTGRLGEISPEMPVVVYCASGGRSNNAATILANAGFQPVYDMQGGIGAWKAASYPVVM